MHQFLTLRATHLRPPSITASASGEVNPERADFTTVATDVPLAIAAKSGFLRQGEYGQNAPADFTGYCDHKRTVIEGDVFVVSDVCYRVMFLGTPGGYLRSFDLSRITLN